MPYKSQAQADAAFLAGRVMLKQRIADVAVLLGRAKANLEKLKGGFDEYVALNIDDQIAAIGMQMESYRDKLLAMRNNGLLSEAQVKAAMQQNIAAAASVHPIGRELYGVRRAAEAGLTDQMNLAIGNAILGVTRSIADFSRMTGVTAALKNIWEGVTEPIVTGAKRAGDILKWLPWIALGVGAVVVLPWMIKSVTAAGVLNNPRRRRRKGRRKSSLRSRRRQKGIAPLPLIALAAGAGVAIYSIATSKERLIPTEGGLQPGEMPVGQTILAGSVRLGASAAAVKTRLSNIGVPYEMVDTGTVFEFYVPRTKFTSANNIVRAVRSEYREVAAAA